MKRMVSVFWAMALVAALMVGCGASSVASAESASDVLPDGTYLSTALTTHYAANCAAGIDYDSLYDISFTVENGVFTAITYDIGVNAKSAPESAEISMEDWPFIKLAEGQAQKNLIGQPATKEAVLAAWPIESKSDLIEQGVDVTSGATEACRASRDAIVNIVVMNENGYQYDVDFTAKDAVPTMTMFEGEITGETVSESGRVNKSVQIDDGDYVLYGLVSANNNEIDNTVLDYNFLVQIDVSVSEGKISSMTCSTPNGSAESQTAVAEADAIIKAALEGQLATNDAISAALPSTADDGDFSGSVEAKIVCDMIGSTLKNGYTHIIGWSY